MKESSQNLQAPLLKKDEVAEPSAEKAEPIIPKVSYFSLYRYSTTKEKFLMIAGVLAAAVAGAAFPFFMIFFGDVTMIFDPYHKNQAEAKGLQILIKFFIIGGVAWVSAFIGLYTWGYTGSRIASRFKEKYYNALLAQEVAWYDSNDVNKLSTKVAANIVAIEAAIGDKVPTFLLTIVMSIFGFFYAYFKCWQLSLVLTGLLPLMLIAGAMMMKGLTLLGLKNKVSYEEASGKAEQAFGGIKTVKSLVGQKFELSKFVDSLMKGKSKAIKYTLIASASLGVTILIFLGVYSLGFWYGKMLIIWHPQKYDAPTIIGTFFCFIIGGSSIGQIAPILKNFVEGKIAAGDFYYLINRKKTLIQPKNGKKIAKIQGINFKNVSFAYKKVDQQENKEHPLVLKNVNIAFEKNKVTALVGQSGCGKSTIVQLLLRYYDACEGQVEINDVSSDEATTNAVNIKEININSYRRKIGFVGQEPVLFAMSIQENLKLANEKMTEEEMIKILKKANAWEFIQKMEKGVKSFVGPGGAQLSGGQKQRIAIARALAKNPDILILDEATSALDRKNEKEIQQTLQNLQQTQITTIVVAHRLSTIKNAHKILVFKKGELLQQGTHQELLSLDKYYSELVKGQMAAAKTQKKQGQQEEELEEPQILRKVSSNRKKSEKQQQIEQPTQASLVNNTQKEEQIPKQKQDAVFRKLIKFSTPHIGFLIVGAVSAIANGMVWPFFNIAFSSILGLMPQAEKNSAQIDNYCFLFLAVALLGGLATFSYSFNFGVVAQRVIYDLRVIIFQKLMKSPAAYFDKSTNTPGAISTKLATNTTHINTMVTGVLAVICLNLSTVVTSLVIAFYYSWMLTLIVLGLSPLLMIAGAINMAIIKRMTTQSEESEKFLGSLISDTVCNIRTVKSFGNPKNFKSKFEGKLNELKAVADRKTLTNAFFQGMSRGMIMIIEGFTFWIAAKLFASGDVTDGQSVFIAIFSVIFAAMGVGQNSSFMPDMGKAKHSGAGLFDIIQSKDQSQHSLQNGGTQQIDVDGSIQFRNVTFKYPQRDQIVLQKFSLIIKPHEKIAFVGPSGSGKSTIIQLLMRFYQPTEGQILINGVPLSSIDLYSYRNQVGLVSQQPTLFLGTVEDNIKYNRQIPQEEIKQNAVVTHCDAFIKEWPQGYKKEVGQKGSQVSGGQKQRIALTRCLVRKPNIILLDESTSALDADTEKIVFENLKPVLHNKTSISIAHRLSTIEDADRIIVMRDGKIIQEGKYHDLLREKNHFYRLSKGE